MTDIFYILHYYWLHYYLVLHPQHKLKYFEQAGWEPAWIKTAKEIVWVKFEEYAASVWGVWDDHEMLPPVIEMRTKVSQQFTAI
jgi:hypothetical protein